MHAAKDLQILSRSDQLLCDVKLSFFLHHALNKQPKGLAGLEHIDKARCYHASLENVPNSGVIRAIY